MCGSWPGLLHVGELDRSDEPTDHHIALGLCGPQTRCAVRTDRFEDATALCQGMAVDVVPQNILFMGSRFEIRKRGHVLQARWRGRRSLWCFLKNVKQIFLPAFAIGQPGGARSHGSLNARQDRRAVGPQRIHCSSLCEALGCCFIHDRRIEAAAKIVQAAVRTIPLPLNPNGRCRRHAAAFDRRQSKYNPAVGHREVNTRCVDVWRRYLDSHPSAVLDVLDQRVFLFKIPPSDIAGEKCCHKLDRPVRFQIGRLPGQQGVGRRMAFVKPVAGKFFDEPKELFGLLLRKPLGVGPVHKLLSKRRDRFNFLFTDRFNARIGAG